MKYFIHYPIPGKERRAVVVFTSYEEAVDEYKRLQDIYPSREMSLVVENDWGERTHIHSGRWK